ncbi:MAG TPA: chemotaxis protein CheW [Kofleriaceae bacterium]|jgi:purine-binding chemotaxis protein CheW|nr:chemotaxis protein CheW [Kofleriaceae bacterium]
MTSLHVAFRVGTAEYVVPAAQVLHLESFQAATHVPGAPPYVAGLVQVRGRVVPVIDLRKRFGLPPTDHTLDHRVVVVQLGTRVVGLLVDSARDVIQLDEASFQDAPELIKQQASGFVTGVVSVRNRLFLIVDVPRVIGQEHAS